MDTLEDAKARLVVVLNELKNANDELMFPRDYVTMKTLRQFMTAAGQLPGNWQTTLLYRELINEEVNETFAAFECLNSFAAGGSTPLTEDELRIAVLDGICDTMVTLMGFAEGLNMDVISGYNAVMRSNLTKIMPDGTVKKNGLGKVIKPETYEPPRLEACIN